MLASKLKASATACLHLVGVLGLMACDSAGVDRSLQSIDGLAAIEHAQQFAAEHVVEEVVAQEYGAQQSAEMHDRFIEWIAPRRRSVARRDVDGAGVSGMHGGDEMHGVVPV